MGQDVNRGPGNQSSALPVLTIHFNQPAACVLGIHSVFTMTMFKKRWHCDITFFCQEPKLYVREFL